MARFNMITKFNKYLITESPDSIETDGKEYKYTDKQAIPFFFAINDNGTNVEQVYIGRKGTMHCDIDFPSGLQRAYPGRLWRKSKLISFWVYPDAELFKNMIHSLENKLGIKMFKNGWQIEVIEENGRILKRDYDEDIYMRNPRFRVDSTIISLDYYTGSNDVPEEIKLQHLMNWKEKELAKKSGNINTGNFGSNLTSWDKPHNIKYRQKIYQENKKA